MTGITELAEVEGTTSTIGYLEYSFSQEGLCLCDSLMCLLCELEDPVLEQGGNDDPGSLQYTVMSLSRDNEFAFHMFILSQYSVLCDCMPSVVAFESTDLL